MAYKLAYPFLKTIEKLKSNVMLQVIKTNTKNLIIFSGFIVAIIVMLSSPVFAKGIENEAENKAEELVAYYEALEELEIYFAEKTAYNKALEELEDVFFDKTDEFDLPPVVKIFDQNYQLIKEFTVEGNNGNEQESYKDMLRQNDLFMTYENISYYMINK